MGKVILGAILGAGLLLFCFALFSGSSRSTLRNRQPNSEAETPAISLTAVKLWSDYQANEVSADDAYKGRRLLVRGQVASINKDFLDKTYLELATPNEFMQVHAELKPEYVSLAAQIYRGQIVLVECNGRGMVIGSPMLEDCSIQSGQQTSVPNDLSVQEPSKLDTVTSVDGNDAPPITPVQLQFIGCKTDGQVGPQDAPTGKTKAIMVSGQLAEKLAFYETSDGLGVVAPRGWYCLGTYGSSGSNLYVTPTPLTSADVFADKWKGISGPAIQLSVSFGDTSGRFAVAKTIARIFPAHQAFVKRVVAEGLEPATDFPSGPYPEDKLNYLGQDAVEYLTPPGTSGLGTDSFLVKDGNPIFGVVLFADESSNLTHLSARLPHAMSDLLAVTLREVERDANKSEPVGAVVR